MLRRLACREAALTGESMPVEKVARWQPGQQGAFGAAGGLLGCRNLAFMGTHVVSGAPLGLPLVLPRCLWAAQQLHPACQRLACLSGLLSWQGFPNSLAERRPTASAVLRLCRQRAGSGGGHRWQHLHQHLGGCAQPAGRWQACSCWVIGIAPSIRACDARLPRRRLPIL